MKYLLFFILLIFTSTCFADTTLSRDGEGLKMHNAAYGSIRSLSVGTKGFACFSTLNKIAWEVKLAATSSVDGAGVGFKMFYNENELTNFPVSGSFFQHQNSPVSKSPTINKVCLRAYSTSVLKTAYGVFQ